MQIAWKNGFLVIGRERMIGPTTHSIFLAWNDIEVLTGVAPKLGAYSHADHIQITWEWPDFRGFTFRRYEMDWRQFEHGNHRE